MYTKVQIREILETSQLAVERGILRIYSFQTTNEQAIQDTNVTNGKGYSMYHAKFMSSLAEFLLKSRRPEGERLTPKQLASARKIIVKYAGQLADFANGKLA